MSQRRPSGKPPRGVSARAVSVVTRPSPGNAVPPNVTQAQEDARQSRLPARRDRLAEAMGSCIYDRPKLPENAGELGGGAGPDPLAYTGTTPSYPQSVKIAKGSRTMPRPFLNNRGD